jgi:hypothetical protein
MKRLSTMVVAFLLGAWLVGDRTRAADGDPKPTPGVDQTAAEFWGRWEGVKPSEAIRRAATTPDHQRDWDETGQRADDFQSRSGGRCLGHSEIARKSLGDNMHYVAFLALYDPMPVRVQLLFYRAKDTWTIIDLRLDAEPHRWLEEAQQSQMPAPPPTTNQ